MNLSFRFPRGERGISIRCGHWNPYHSVITPAQPRLLISITNPPSSLISFKSKPSQTTNQSTYLPTTKMKFILALVALCITSVAAQAKKPEICAQEAAAVPACGVRSPLHQFPQCPYAPPPPFHRHLPPLLTPSRSKNASKRPPVQLAAVPRTMPVTARTPRNTRRLLVNVFLLSLAGLRLWPARMHRRMFVLVLVSLRPRRQQTELLLPSLPRSFRWVKEERGMEGGAGVVG